MEIWHEYMNECLNGNLAQMPVIHIDALLTPKKKGSIAFGLNVVLLNIKYCSILFYKVVNKFPHYDKLLIYSR